jgi:hypothetical protein
MDALLGIGNEGEMHTFTSELWLIVFFRPALTMALVPKVEFDRFRVGALEYRCMEPNYLTAFYDRLVGEHDRLVGLHVTPASDAAEEMLRQLNPAEYLVVSDSQLDIFLAGHSRHDAVNTGDQAFGGQIFRAESGEFALSLDVNYLCMSETDFAAITGAKAVWVDLRWE